MLTQYKKLYFKIEFNYFSGHCTKWYSVQDESGLPYNNVMEDVWYCRIFGMKNEIQKKMHIIFTKKQSLSIS